MIKSQVFCNLLSALALMMAVLLTSSPGQAAEIEDVIRMCESCHGPKGVSEHDDVPSLAGREAQYIVEAIDDFYFFQRHCPMRQIPTEEGEELTSESMCVIASELAEEEIAELAKYFSAQPSPDQAPR